jgi:hypothetical protein
MSSAEALRASVEEVERCCAALVAGRPEALEACPGTLESAARRLLALRPGLNESAGDAEMLAEAWRLRRGVRRAGVLLENAATYHGGWTALLGLQLTGYRPGGLPGEVTPAGRVWMQG